MTKPPSTIDTLPLFSDDEKIGEAVLGRERKKEFKGLATLLEPQGMPKINPLWGCRYVPAVKAFLDRASGLSAPMPLNPGGVERPWLKQKDPKAKV